MITEHGDFNEVIDLKTGRVIMTAEKHYQYWLDSQQIDILTGPTVEEQLLATQKMVLSLQEQIIDML